jgi:hypothetical protein
MVVWSARVGGNWVCRSTCWGVGGWVLGVGVSGSEVGVKVQEYRCVLEHLASLNRCTDSSPRVCPRQL